MRVAVGSRAVQPDQQHENKEVHRAEQRGVKLRVRRVRGKTARYKKHIYRKKEQIAEHHEGGGAGRQLRLVTVPPTACTKKNSGGCDKRSEKIDFSCSDKGEGCGEQQKEKRNGGKTVRGQDGGRPGWVCVDHDRSF